MSEIQESYALLMQIDKLLADIELKINNIQKQAPQLERNLNNFRQLERVMLRYLVLARRLGLPDEVEGVLQKISQVIMMVRMLQISMSMLMLATGPVGMLMGAAGLGITALSLGDMLSGY